MNDKPEFYTWYEERKAAFPNIGIAYLHYLMKYGLEQQGSPADPAATGPLYDESGRMQNPAEYAASVLDRHMKK